MPTVSVNTCTYNSARFVVETLRSVFAQTFQDFEIVIVDDGSSDGTPDLIEELFPDPRLVVVRQRHVTLRQARPLALAHSRGEFIAFLDSDDVWKPHKLERQIALARAAPDVGLVFSDSDLIDAAGQPLGRFSDQFPYANLDLTGTHGHIELLRCGNFIASPTPLAPAAAIRAVGGFNEAYRHVNDYELWLRLARRYRLAFIEEPLALYRLHDAQFTQRRPEVTLPEQRILFEEIRRSASYPAVVRRAVGDNLLGQHRLAARLFVRQRRYWLAARATAGMCRYPDRLADFVRHRLADTTAGRVVEGAIAASQGVRHGMAVARDLASRAGAQVANGVRHVAVRARRAPARIIRVLRGQEAWHRETARTESREPPSSPWTPQVWIDGTSLGREQTGYFNLLAELVRRLCQQPGQRSVHVVTTGPGRLALLGRLGGDGATIHFHRAGWRGVHWSHVYRAIVSWQAQVLLALASAAGLAVAVALRSAPIATAIALPMVLQAAILLDEIAAIAREGGGGRVRHLARLIRYLWRRFPAPRRRAPAHATTEILFWRGRFRWWNSHRIAIVQDLTTRIRPGLHTAGNVAEFEEFIGYVQRHAQTIATVSEHSRRDIIDRIAVNPESVRVLPMPIHPQYVDPIFSEGFVACHGITGPFILSVATIEPRKNLRRLIKAFELVREDPAARDAMLVLVGLHGWDSGFRDFLLSTSLGDRLRMPGFVALDHLPSLYHYASAVVCPSLYEGFGIPVMEAMCSSGVVLASRVSSLPEVLGVDGILFDPLDTQDIASALLRALTLSPADAASYRRRCRTRAEAHLERVTCDGLFASAARDRTPEAS